MGKDVYESADACRYILWNYEEYLAAKMGMTATINEEERREVWKLRASDSIEHIFPQNPRWEDGWSGKMRRAGGDDEPIPENVGRIGNLVLLPTVLNSEARSSGFDTKKKIYLKHSLRMIKEIGDQQDWTLAEIDQRDAQLVAWAKIRWADV